MRFPASVLLIIAALALLSAPAAAHAEAASSTPGFGERLSGSPSSVTVRFTQQIDAGNTELVLVNGTLVAFALGVPRVGPDGLSASADVLAPLPAGSYAIKWRVLSLSDGHTTRGAIPFVIGNDAALLEVGEGGEENLRPDAVAGKTFAFLGLAVVVGAFGFWYLVLPRGSRKGHEGIVERVALVAAWMHLLGVALFAYSQVDISGLGPSGYLLGTAYGQGVLVRAVVGALIVGALSYAARRPDVPRSLWAGTVVVAVALFFVYGRFSHTGGHLSPSWLGLVVDGVHLTAVGVWFGGLLTFVLFLRSLPDRQGELAAHLRLVPGRFSTVALWSVALAAATGVVMSLSIVGVRPSDWTDPTYSRLLVAKIGLALAMVALGAVNKLVYVARYQRGEEVRSVRAFRANVLREVVVGLFVFVLAGLLTNASPPQTVSSSAAPGPEPEPVYFGEDRFVVELATEHYDWSVTFHPVPALGVETHFVVDLFARATNTRDTSAHPVRILIANTDAPDLGTTTIPANRTVAGEYEAFGSYFPVAGTYNVTIEATSGAVGAYRERAYFEFEV